MVRKLSKQHRQRHLVLGALLRRAARQLLERGHLSVPRSLLQLGGGVLLLILLVLLFLALLLLEVVRLWAHYVGHRHGGRFGAQRQLAPQQVTCLGLLWQLVVRRRRQEERAALSSDERLCRGLLARQRNLVEPVVDVKLDGRFQLPVKHERHELELAQCLGAVVAQQHADSEVALGQLVVLRIYVALADHALVLVDNVVKLVVERPVVHAAIQHRHAHCHCGLLLERERVLEGETVGALAFPQRVTSSVSQRCHVRLLGTQGPLNAVELHARIEALRAQRRLDTQGSEAIARRERDGALRAALSGKAVEVNLEVNRGGAAARPELSHAHLQHIALAHGERRRGLAMRRHAEPLVDLEVAVALLALHLHAVQPDATRRGWQRACRDGNLDVVSARRRHDKFAHNGPRGKVKPLKPRHMGRPVREADVGGLDNGDRHAEKGPPPGCSGVAAYYLSKV
mmetsp:Transcript_2542/g.10139  ORF Transcript_2542/g.10139 Transcript_2542/m.10139 type:complete len:456 (-) Transcript_2542:1987-3354(-)